MSNEVEDFIIEDDLKVDENYKVADSGPRPPLPGTYAFTTSKWGFRKNADGELVLWKDSQGNPRYPVIGLTTLEIVDPFEFGRKVVVFQDVSTKPFEREGSMVSNAADLLRSFDAGVQAGNTSEVLAMLTDRLNDGQAVFKARLDYEAYDGEFAKAEIARAGGKAALSPKELNAVYDRAKIRGAGRIAKSNAANNRGDLPIHKWLGPSGNIVDAKPRITVFIPANDTSVTLGPDKKYLA